MSVSFWDSSQAAYNDGYMRMPAGKKRSEKATKLDGEALSEDQIQVMKMWLVQKIFMCASHLKLRVRVAATASIYVKRFYLRNAFMDHDPMAYAPACILLAAKVEETPQIWPKHILDQWSKVISLKLVDHVDKDAVLEAECRVLTELNTSLLMHHPYRPLELFLSDAAAARECTSNAWSMVNDSFIFDVGLSHPPYIIALACMYMSSVMGEKDLQHWYTNSNADTAVIHEVMQEMLKGYDLMGSADFGRLKEEAQRVVIGAGKARAKAAKPRPPKAADDPVEAGVSPKLPG